MRHGGERAKRKHRCQYNPAPRNRYPNTVHTALPEIHPSVRAALLELPQRRELATAQYARKVYTTSIAECNHPIQI
jgi:hypothetical protein